MEHDAVGADVDPAVVGVTGDVEGTGADVAAAVPGVPARRREDGHVDLVAAADVLEDGAVFDVFRWEWLQAADLLAPLVRHFDFGHAERQAEGQRDAIGCAEAVDQDFEVGIVARYLVEHGRWRLGGVLEHVGGRADVLLRGGAVNAPELTHPIDLFQPGAEASGLPRCRLPLQRRDHT